MPASNPHRRPRAVFLRIVRGQILDTRDSAHVLCKTSALPPDATAELRHAITRAHGTGIKAIAATYIISGIIVATVFMIPIARKGDTERLLLMSVLYLMLNSFFILAHFAIATISRGKALRRAATRCLAENLCPACAYRLAGIPPTADNLRICPECGGTWPEREARRQVVR